MKKTFIIFLIIIFNINISYAKNDSNITIEEVNNFLKHFRGEGETSDDRISRNLSYLYDLRGPVDLQYVESEYDKTKRLKRRLAKCMNKYGMRFVKEKPIAYLDKFCHQRIIKTTFSRSKKSQKKFPGDIFYAFAALENLIFKSTIKFEKKSSLTAKSGFLKKQYVKKIERFKKDPSNEKLLGKALIRGIKLFRVLPLIRASVGVNESMSTVEPPINTRYLLMGDMLNSRVADTKKNKINPDIKKREVLLKKYSNTLFSIKKKLEQNNYKNLDANVLTLSTAFKNLNELQSSISEFGKNFDLAIDSISDSNKLIEISTLNAQKKDGEKLLALSSIKIMENLISSISNNLPDEYEIIPPKIENVFSKTDNQNIEQIIQDVNVVRGNELAELTQSMNVVDTLNLSEYAKSNSNYKYSFSYKTMNSSDVMKTLNKLGINNTIDRSTLSALNKRLSTPDTAAEAAAKQLKDSLDREWAKEVFNNMSVYENVSNVAGQAVQNVMNETSVNNIDTSTPEGAKEWGKEVFGSMSVSGPD